MPWLRRQKLGKYNDEFVVHKRDAIDIDSFSDKKLPGRGLQFDVT